jgi:hypothetical protein
MIQIFGVGGSRLQESAKNMSKYRLMQVVAIRYSFITRQSEYIS